MAIYSTCGSVMHCQESNNLWDSYVVTRVLASFRAVGMDSYWLELVRVLVHLILELPACVLGPGLQKSLTIPVLSVPREVLPNSPRSALNRRK